MEGQRKSHAEPCVELDLVLVQHLKKSRADKTLKQIQSDKSGLLPRQSWMAITKVRGDNHDPPGKEY